MPFNINNEMIVAVFINPMLNDIFFYTNVIFRSLATKVIIHFHFHFF